MTAEKGGVRKMKDMKKAIITLLVFCMACALPFPAEAKEKYGYKIRIFAGDRGTIDGSEVIIYDNQEYGTELSFDYNRRVKVEDGSKYYVKGIRECGTDTSTVIEAKVKAGTGDIKTAVTVTGDRDYVVSYGALGSSVAYTVRYEDEAGNELASAETYYGNIGDQPVIAFLYIENYLPRAYNLTGTLKEDAASNVFTFVYNPVSREAADAALQAAEAARAAATRGMAGETAGGQTDTAAEAAAQAAATEAAAQAEGVTPEDLVSVDEEETPLSNMGLDGEGTAGEIQDFARLLLDIPAAAKAGIPSIAVLCIVGIVLLLERRKRKTKNAK